MGTTIRIDTGIWKLPDGRFQVRFQPIDQKTGKPKWMRRTVNTLAEATAELAKMRRDGAGVRTKPTEEPVLEFARTWMRRRKKHLRDGTQDRYYDALELQFLPALGNVLCSKLTAGDIDDWLDDCTKGNRFALRDAHYARLDIENGLAPRKPYAPAPHANGTINGWLAVVKMMTRAMAAEKGIPDAARDIKPLPTKVRQEHESNSLAPEEISKLVSYCFDHQPQWYGFMVLGFLLGARPGELRPLRWGIDLNLETGTIILQQSERRGVLNPTKTKMPRKAIMPGGLITAMTWHRNWLHGSGHPGARAGLVFPGWGTWRPWHKMAVIGSDEIVFMSCSAFDKPLAAMCRAVGIVERKITPRTMRRSAHDTGRGLQIDPLVMEVLVGHQSQAMRGRYSHIRLTETHQALTKMSNEYRLPTSDPTREGKKAK